MHYKFKELFPNELINRTFTTDTPQFWDYYATQYTLEFNYEQKHFRNMASLYKSESFYENEAAYYEANNLFLAFSGRVSYILESLKHASVLKYETCKHMHVFLKQIKNIDTECNRLIKEIKELIRK